MHGAAERFLNLTWLAGPQAGPVLQMLLGIGIIVGCLALWAVLLFRKAALLLVAVFAPIAFAGAVWDQTRVWARRWIEIVAALVLCKVVIVVTFVVGASAFSGIAPGTRPDRCRARSSTAVAPGGLSDVLVGLLLLAIAVLRAVADLPVRALDRHGGRLGHALHRRREPGLERRRGRPPVAGPVHRPAGH